MKLQTWMAIVILGTALAARGTLYREGAYTTGFTLGTGNIPEGNATGWWDTRNVSDIPSGLVVGGVTVTFSISGGFNGDLTGYLSHDGMLMPLLNRVGTGTGDSFGYGDAGFNGVKLADDASVNIHNYGGGFVPNGTYAPDSSGATFTATFGGKNPGGDWTLIFADLSSGGGQSQVVSWELGITAVPEPVNVALGVFAGVFLIAILARSRPVRIRISRWRVAIVQWLDAV